MRGTHSITVFQDTRDPEYILKASGMEVGKLGHIKGIRIASDFLTITLEVKRKWSNAFTILRENDLQCRILYPHDNYV